MEAALMENVTQLVAQWGQDHLGDFARDGVLCRMAPVQEYEGGRSVRITLEKSPRFLDIYSWFNGDFEVQLSDEERAEQRVLYRLLEQAEEAPSLLDRAYQDAFVKPEPLEDFWVRTV